MTPRLAFLRRRGLGDGERNVKKMRVEASDIDLEMNAVFNSEGFVFWHG